MYGDMGLWLLQCVRTVCFRFNMKSEQAFKIMIAQCIAVFIRNSVRTIQINYQVYARGSFKALKIDVNDCSDAQVMPKNLPMNEKWLP